MTAVDGHPFSAVSLDNETFLVSVFHGNDNDGAVVMLRPIRENFVSARSLPIGDQPTGLAVNHDGRLVAVAADHMTVLLDPTRLLSQQGNPVVARV